MAEIKSHGTFAVVVTDMNMDGMNGIEFLKQVQQKTPDSVRLMLTGANLESAIAAVNEGRIFRFLTKPCSAETLRQAIDASLEQYRLVTAERTVLSTTLLGAIKILVDTLSAIRPVAFGRATRVRNIVYCLARELACDQVWQVEVAALLSQVGCVFLAEETLRKVYAGEELNPREAEAFQSHPAAGSTLVANVLGSKKSLRSSPIRTRALTDRAPPMTAAVANRSPSDREFSKSRSIMIRFLALETARRQHCRRSTVVVAVMIAKSWTLCARASPARPARNLLAVADA